MATYYKCLRPAAVSPFTGTRWAPGVWVEGGAPTGCRGGIHAARAGDLPYWLQPEIWVIELGGLVVDVPSGRKVVASRACLGERVAAWDSEAYKAFSVTCALRTGELAAEDLIDVGLALPAADLQAGIGTVAESSEVTPEAITELMTLASACAAAASAPSARTARRLCLFFHDCLEWLGEYPPAAFGFVAAHAAEARSRLVPDAAEAERVRQAEWLTARLGLGA